MSWRDPTYVYHNAAGTIVDGRPRTHAELFAKRQRQRIAAAEKQRKANADEVTTKVKQLTTKRK